MKPKIYTIYSDSHLELFHEFLSSTVNLGETFEICPVKITQEGSGHYDSQEFKIQMLKKIGVIIKAIEDHLESGCFDYFIYSDCDIVFLPGAKNLASYINNNFNFPGSIYFMQDNYFNRPFFCAGFFVCPATPASLDYFLQVGKLLAFDIKFNTHTFHDDQDIINRLPNYQHCHRLLDRQLFCNLSNIEFRDHVKEELKQTKEGILFNKLPSSYLSRFDPGAMVFHANFTKGIENKLKLMGWALS
jgi:hypothetical protein